MKRRKNIKKAFSLMELSIVILILAVLITGASTVAIGNINEAKINLTNERIQQIYKALGAYVAQNNALPCPAAITNDKFSINYGLEITSGGACTTATGVYVSGNASNLYYGMVPIKVLGLANDIAEDGFGSKFAYIVDKRMHISFGKIADPPGSGTLYFQTVAPFEPTSSTMVIKECLSASCTTSRIVSNYGAFAIISYGPNKSGAYSAESDQRNTRSTDEFELSNDVNASSSPYFYFNSYLVKSTLNTNIFDDIVFHKSRNEMAVDFNLFDKIYCTKPGSDFPNNSDYDYYSYGMIAYASTACGNRTSIRLTKKCGPLGKWIDIVSACP